MQLDQFVSKLTKPVGPKNQLFDINDWKKARFRGLTKGHLLNREVYVGFDQSRADGIFSFCVLAPKGFDHFEVWTYFWLTLDRFDALPRTAVNVRAVQSVKDPVDLLNETVRGFDCTVCPDSSINQCALYQDIKAVFETVHVKSIAYDMMKIGALATAFDQTPAVSHLTLPLTFDRSTRLLRQLLADGKLVHSDNNLMNWMVGSTVDADGVISDLLTPGPVTAGGDIGGVNALLLALSAYCEDLEAAASAL